MKNQVANNVDDYIAALRQSRGIKVQHVLDDRHQATSETDTYAFVWGNDIMVDRWGRFYQRVAGGWRELFHKYNKNGKAYVTAHHRTFWAGLETYRAFHGNFDIKTYVVDHKDGDPTNCELDNLFLVRRNRNDRNRHGNEPGRYGADDNNPTVRGGTSEQEADHPTGSTRDDCTCCNSHSEATGGMAQIEPDGSLADFIKESLGDPRRIREFHVYQWRHLEYCQAMRTLESFFESPADARPYVEAAEERLKRAGWEGDGMLQILWLPPFLGEAFDNDIGIFCIHVRQAHEGVSWIASPIQLKFPALLEQQWGKVSISSSAAPMRKGAADEGGRR